jgi:hypothetical protein
VLRRFDESATEKKKMVRALHATPDVVHRRFGRSGENCKEEKWHLNDKRSRSQAPKSRLDEEKNLERSITEKLERSITGTLS